MAPNTLEYKGDEIKAHHSVSQDVFDRRIYDLGWDAKRAAVTPYHPPRRNAAAPTKGNTNG